MAFAKKIGNGSELNSKIVSYKQFAKASFLDFTASPSVFTLRSSASGGLKPFSEEKGFKTSKKTFVRCARVVKKCSLASQKAPRERGALTLSITAAQPA